MYLVREIMIAKPGYAGELADLMKEEMSHWPDFKGYILLDLVTNYNKIVVEFELESLASFEKMMSEVWQKKQEAKAKGPVKPSRYTELYQVGKREIYRII